MSSAGLLLTGGASRRMGRDKADIVVGPSGQTLARRTAAILAAATDPVLEVGPGRSGLPAVADAAPGEGPLAAVATGAAALRARGWEGGAVVVATDLPRLPAPLVDWLADAGPGSVVPVVGGTPQPLCARYSAATLELAGGLVAAGHRAMRDLLDAAPDLELVAPARWVALAGDPDGLADADRPEDLARLLDHGREPSAGRPPMSPAPGSAR